MLVANYRIVHCTHVGLVRDHNEDRLGVWNPPPGAARGPIAIVADGLGGHAAGEVASGIAVEEVLGAYQNNSSDDIREVLCAGIQAAHEKTLGRAQEDPKLRGMGTTCTTVAIQNDKLYLAHVGDSRAYRFRDGIERLTLDHTVAQALLEEDLLAPDQVDDHPGAHVLTRALGMAEPLRIDTPSPEEVRPGDLFLLCSDGLTGQVSDREIEQVLSTMAPEEAVETLVNMACDAGGPDNISVIILTAEADDA